MHQHKPTVVRLQLHLPHQQMILFNPNQVSHDQILHRPTIHKTNLTEFFEACRQYPNARMLTYPNFPTEFVWDKPKKVWKPRKKGKAIGRVYFAGPAAGERYYLRMLLYIVRGPTSWEDLQTVNGVVHSTFKAACAARGLLATDDEFHYCLQEAATMQTGRQLRHLFAIILLQCAPANPLELWSTHAEKLSDDCQWRLLRKGIPIPTKDQIQSLALHDLDKILLCSGKSLQDFGLPLPNHSFESLQQNLPQVIIEETSFDKQHLDNVWRQCLSMSNSDQHTAFQAVISAYESDKGGIFFIDGPGGTGKTFVENMILARVRSTGDIALAVAASGIAALLLDGGRTAHSRFKIPINIQSDSCCPISAQSDLAKLIQQTKVVIWDEAPMQHRHLSEAVNRTLQDIRKCDKPFGGAVTVFAGEFPSHSSFLFQILQLTNSITGDFRQCPAVIPHGTRSEIVDASIKNSSFWSEVVMLPLTTNMRLLRNRHLMTPQEREEAENFAAWVLQVGNGLADGDKPGLLRLPEEFCIPPNHEDSVDQLIAAVYPEINTLTQHEDT
jgi:hypothetical protein